ncbi:7545_t:CDS:2 [Ambispora leptoticha]|uniref:7545_t:CDS:1 n=1 Tax=Ambispora leptoticha TaxID=144679 RepID=A0A9N8ZYB2_9GLOM|nr:7545_t:CDS:2 [Ambispora leptoticha]
MYKYRALNGIEEYDENEGEDYEEIINPKDFPELYPNRDVEKKNKRDQIVLRKADENKYEKQTNPKYENLGNYADQGDGKYIPLWQRRAATPGIMDHPSKKSILADLKKDNALEKYGSKVIDIVRVLEDEGVSNLSIIDVRNKCDWTDWMIVGEGKGSRHLGGLVDGVYKMLKNKLQQHTEKTDPTGSLIDNYPIIEGRDSEDWMLIDAGSIMVHLFTEEARDLYDLEGLWANIPEIGKQSTVEGILSMKKEFDDSQMKPKKLHLHK